MPEKLAHQAMNFFDHKKLANQSDSFYYTFSDECVHHAISQIKENPDCLDTLKAISRKFSRAICSLKDHFFLYSVNLLKKHLLVYFSQYHSEKTLKPEISDCILSQFVTRKHIASKILKGPHD
jgi:hypothetical protein